MSKVDVAVGKLVYTQWLNERAGIEADLTITRIGLEEFMVVTAAACHTRDLAWLRQLEMPDIPVRWDARVVRYLEYYRQSARGRSMVASWIKKSGRYGAAIRRVLREQNLPEDILWLALVESGLTRDDAYKAWTKDFLS